MDCASLSEIIGHDCHLITDDGSIMVIETPYCFAEGDEIVAYAELGPGLVRFFDDGDVFDYFDGLGMRMESDAETHFLSGIAESHGLSFNRNGEVEICATPDLAATAFAQYISAMLAFVKWEKERAEGMTVLSREGLGRVA